MPSRRDDPDLDKKVRRAAAAKGESVSEFLRRAAAARVEETLAGHPSERSLWWSSPIVKDASGPAPIASGWQTPHSGEESVEGVMADTQLLVVGAGPYGVGVAAHALERGIETTVLGRPMEFWTGHMPEGMFLRSGFDWHLDASAEHTFEAFAEDEGISPEDVDPVPIAVFLAYAAWFQEHKKVAVTGHMVTTLERDGDLFVAQLDNHSRITAERVVAAPGMQYFAQLPQWAPSLATRGAHTADAVCFDEMAGARVLVVGGRQSAYEWAALLGEHGAARVDIVHHHPEPHFGRVSWAFVDPYMAETVAAPGWWRSLPPEERRAIERRFWEVGRLTLEWWLEPRLSGERFHRWPTTSVDVVEVVSDGTVDVRLSIGERLAVDRVLFATGYRPDLSKVPYLRHLLPDIETDDGFPVLDEWFQTSVPGLSIPGFAATRDFGPFFGFTKGCPAAARLLVDGLLQDGRHAGPCNSPAVRTLSSPSR
jgi:FAD-dependent urate hydroxylase